MIKSYHYFIPFVITSLFAIALGCSPVTSTVIGSPRKSLQDSEKIFVVDIGEKLPVKREEIGKVSVNLGAAYWDASYAYVLNKAEQRARRLGGNLIKIDKHIFRDDDRRSLAHGGQSHGDIIQAIIFKVAPDWQIRGATEYLGDSMPVIPSGEKYALLYVYRVPSVGPIVSFNLHLDKKKICRVNYLYNGAFKLTKEGDFTLWGRTESKSSVSFHVEFGKSYFLKCQILTGAFIGEPDLKLESENQGWAEYCQMHPNSDGFSVVDITTHD